MKPPPKRAGTIAVVAVMAILAAFVWWEKHRFSMTVRNETERDTMRAVRLVFGRETVSIDDVKPGETATITDLRLAGESPLQVMFQIGRVRCLHENESVLRERGSRIEVEIRSCYTSRSRSGSWLSVWTSKWTSQAQ